MRYPTASLLWVQVGPHAPIITTILYVCHGRSIKHTSARSSLLACTHIRERANAITAFGGISGIITGTPIDIY